MGPVVLQRYFIVAPPTAVREATKEALVSTCTADRAIPSSLSLTLLHDNHQVHPLVHLTIQVIGACMDILFASTFISNSFLLCFVRSGETGHLRICRFFSWH